MLTRHFRSPASRQRGLSLIELLVGIAVGMFVVAAASTLVASQLIDNRRLMLELQVQQDLRVTADIITRDLRRAGSNGFQRSAAQMGNGVEEVDLEVGVTPVSVSTSHDQVEFLHWRRNDTQGPYGYRLATSAAGTGVIQTAIPLANSWADLTDADAVDIRTFTITPENETGVRLACPRLCAVDPTKPDPTKWCWPRVTVRTFVIDIRGASRSDPSVVRAVRSIAKVRNEFVEFTPATSAAPSVSCP